MLRSFLDPACTVIRPVLPILAAMSDLERRLPWIIVALAAVAGILGFALGQRVFTDPPGAGAPTALQASLLYPQPRELPAFELTRSDGTRLTNADWKGRWRLLFFGFASCPEICPTTLSTLKAALAQLHESNPGADIGVSFVSVDPERDTPEALGNYVKFFDPAFEAATGTPEQLLTLTRAVGVVFMKNPTGPGPLDYTIDHSASLLIIDPDGRLAGLMRPPHAAPAIAADLAQLLNRSSRN